MEAMRTVWTDERLDDLNRKVDEQGRRMDAGFAEVRTELRELRAETGGRFDAMQRTTLLGFASLLASILATQL
jgi:hypothetical protein